MFRYAKDGGTTEEKARLKDCLIHALLAGLARLSISRKSTEPLCICFALQN